MKFFEKLFKRKKTTTEQAKKSKKIERSKTYSGPTVALFTDLWWQQQNILIEAKTAADISSIPAALLIPYDDGVQNLDIWSAFNLEQDGERAVSIGNDLSASVAISGGRSFFRPAWFADLSKCGGYVFSISNNNGDHSGGIGYQIAHLEIPDCPLLFIINDSDGSQQKIFTSPPSTSDLAKALRIDEAHLSTHPVKIVFCHYDVPQIVPKPQEEEAEGKGKTKSETPAEPAKPANIARDLKNPQEVVEGLKWLSEHVIVDSTAVALKLKEEQEEAEKQKQVVEAAKQQAKIAVPPTVNESENKQTPAQAA